MTSIVSGEGPLAVECLTRYVEAIWEEGPLADESLTRYVGAIWEEGPLELKV